MKNIVVITNGFDNDILDDKSELDTKFSITHIGLMNADRNPKILWKVLLEICEEYPIFKEDLRIRLIGKIDDSVIDNISNFSKKNIERIDYLNHQNVKKYQQKSQILLLAINDVPNAKGILTGKIFEYLQAKRPVLGIGPEDGDAAVILNNTNAGVMSGFKNETKLKSVILNFYKDFKNQQLNADSKNIQQYHRKELTRSLADLIKKTVNN